MPVSSSTASDKTPHPTKKHTMSTINTHGPLSYQPRDTGKFNPANTSRSAGATRAAPTAQEAEAKDTAEKLIATTLIKPILAQARAARDAPAPWGQTQAEKQFGALLDNRIADDIAKSSSFPIAQRIADQIMSNAPIQDTQQSAPKYTPVDIFG